MVAIFYCFVNSEVKNTFKHHFVRWNDARNLRTSGGRRFTYSKDWSPNTRSDSVRYYSNKCHIIFNSKQSFLLVGGDWLFIGGQEEYPLKSKNYSFKIFKNITFNNA